MENSYDRETNKIIEELKEVTNFTESKGFSIIQRRLFEKIELLSDVGNIPDDVTPEQLLLEIRSRKKAIELVHSWWKEDVIGSREQLGTITPNNNRKPWMVIE